jgi:hypothetical protein
MRYELPMTPVRTVLGAFSLALVAAALPAAASHSYGSCVPSPAEACERWSQVAPDPAGSAAIRPDQFGVATLAGRDAVYTVAKDVGFDTADPYKSTATALICAYAKSDGHLLWAKRYADRAYVNVTSATLSPDGSTVLIAGGAYNGFPVGATDSQLLTAAFSTVDGSQRWSAHWDGRPDATDNAKAIEVSPDGTEVYASGVTTSPLGDLDYVTVAWSAADGHQLWAATYTGPKEKGVDSIFGMALSPAQDALYVTGWSDGTVDYDADYATVAYALGHTAGSPGHGKGNGKGLEKKREDGPAAGQQLWVARFDGIGVHKSDRANAVAVSPDGNTVVVTGDSYSGPGGADYGYATVAYDAATGVQKWQARYNGGRGNFNSANQIVTTGNRVLVSGQAKATDTANGNDATTVAYDAASGAQVWVGSIAPARSDDFTRALAVSPNGQTVYAVASDTPLVDYTALTALTVTAYSTATGAVQWTSSVDGGVLNALSGSALSVSPDGQTVAVLGDLKRSANPLGAQNQNIYDVVTTLFTA